VIANGYLRLDPQEWIRAVEKRRAARRGRWPTFKATWIEVGEGVEEMRLSDVDGPRCGDNPFDLS
jgi:hypothetical protein